ASRPKSLRAGRAFSRAMIGVTRQNSRSSVKLLEEHHANHLMRPGRSPKSDPELRLALQIGRKSVGATDCEYSIGHGLVPPPAEQAGQGGAVDIVAVLIERDKHGVFRDCGRYCGRLFGDTSFRLARAALSDLADIRPAEAELAADLAETLLVALRELALRSLFQPADGDDDDSHRSAR